MIIRKVSPEVLTANTDMKCTVKTKKVEPIKETITIQNIPKVGTVVNSEVVDVVEMKPKVSTMSDFSNSILGSSSTVQLKAFAEQGILTGIALEIIRWIH